MIFLLWGAGGCGSLDIDTDYQFQTHSFCQ